MRKSVSDRATRQGGIGLTASFQKFNFSTKPEVDERTLSMMTPEDEPNALSSPAERERRIGMLNQPHIEPLCKYLQTIKAQHPEKDLPSFDPCDGGVFARSLFLLEAPGPKAVDSAFISRNNPDPSARNICGFLQKANISRRDTLLWNIVPWYVGNENRIRAVTKEDIEQSLPYLEELVGLLPLLKVIVLVGKKAQSANIEMQKLTNTSMINTHHPSQRVFNMWPQKKDEMREHLAQVAAILNND